MSSLIDKNKSGAFSAADKIYYENGYVNMINDHKTYLVNHSGTTTLDVAPIDLVHFRANLFGFLKKYRIPKKLWNTIRIMNNLKDPQGFTEVNITDFVYVPSETAVNELTARYKRN